MSLLDTINGLSGLLSYFRLGELSGTSAADEESANTANYFGSYTQGADSLVPSDTADKSLSIAGTGYVHVLQNSSLNIVGDVTIIAIAKWTNSQTTKGLVAKWGSTGDRCYGIFLDSSVADKVLFLLSIGGGIKSIVTTNTYNDDDPHLIIARRSGDDMKLVVANIDDSFEEVTGTGATTSNIDTASAGVRLGNFTNLTTGGFDGGLDEVAILTAAVSDQDILDLIAAWTGTPPPMPVEAAAGRSWALVGSTILQGRHGRSWALSAANIALISGSNRLWTLNVAIESSAAAGRSWALSGIQLETATAGRLWALLAEPITSKTVTTVTYTCLLEGADDSLPDLVLPISSFQGALRTGRPSFLSVNIPDALKYTDDIAARPNGDLTVTRNVIFTDGTSESVEIARVNPPTIRSDRGARSSTVTLSGEKQTTNTSPRSVAISGVSFRGLQADGKRRIRAQLDNNLRAGDEAVIDVTGDTITVDQIQYIVGPSQATMELLEA